MRRVADFLTLRVKGPLKRARNLARSLAYCGSGRFCPVCGRSSRQFRPSGVLRRKDAQCAHCGALERHRLLWHFLKVKTDLFDGTEKRVLHVAPEACFESRLKKFLGDGYVTADLFKPEAMVRMDITRIDFADESFDVILCNHVLEHVQDDRKAMREFVRVLANDGWAILLVPITVEKTFEDPSIVDPEERIKAFGQQDHVRRYGPDYVARLREEGFRVAVAGVNDLFSEDEAIRFGVASEAGEIHLCTK